MRQTCVQGTGCATVSQVLSRCLGYPLVSLAETYETAELARRLGQTAGTDDPSRVTPTHDLYLPRLVVAAASGENTISMHHVVANTQTLWFMTAVNGVMPIVTTAQHPRRPGQRAGRPFGDPSA